MIDVRMHSIFFQTIMRILRKFSPVPEIDLTSLPANSNRIRGERSGATVDTVVTHVTAVRGGFGASPRLLRKWQTLLDGGLVDSVFTKQLEVFPESGHARLLSLWERYAGLPYHWLVVRAVKSHVIHNLPPSIYSYHAGAGNRHSVGWAIDCQFDEKLSNAFIEAGKKSLRCCIQEVRHACKGTVYVQAHRNYSNMRMNDPGATVWSLIVAPVVAEIPYAAVRYELAEGTGFPIPGTWEE